MSSNKINFRIIIPFVFVALGLVGGLVWYYNYAVVEPYNRNLALQSASSKNASIRSSVLNSISSQKADYSSSSSSFNNSSLVGSKGVGEVVVETNNLPNFKVKYDPAIWQAKPNFEFNVFENGDFAPKDGSPSTFSNEVFDVEIFITKILGGGPASCFFQEQDAIIRSLVSDKFYLTIPQDSTDINGYRFYNYNSLATTNDKVEVLDNDKISKNPEFCFDQLEKAEKLGKTSKFDFKSGKIEKDRLFFETSLYSYETDINLEKTNTKDAFVVVSAIVKKVPTEQDLQDLSKLLNSIEGLKFVD